jgi:type II secretory pathway pseudopilin PulG
MELLVVVAVVVILAGLTVPNLMRTVHTSRLRGAATDYAGLLQEARMRSIQDDRFYTVYQLATNNLTQEFVDIYPQNINGASGSGGKVLDPRDPVISVSTEVNQQPWTAAPNTNQLLNQLLGTSTVTTLTPVGSAALVPPLPPASTPPVTGPPTFGPQGLPCTPLTLTGPSGGTVCNSRGGPVAYWLFFQDSISQEWEAVTVTPAGRIQKWSYSGTVWGKL